MNCPPRMTFDINLNLMKLPRMTLVITSLNARKSCGFDNLSVNFLKLGIDVSSSQSTPIIIKCVSPSFPFVSKFTW